MSITLPDASTANTDTTAVNAAEVAAQQVAFIAHTTVLINNAIANGLFSIYPFLPPLVTPDYITTYFTNLGYVVTYPIIVPGPFDPPFVIGFPEVTPPGWTPWSQQNQNIPRIQISWIS